jgi:signal transduction histidine kinase
MEYALPNIKKPFLAFFLFLYIIEMPPTTRSKSKLESEEKKIKEQQFTDYFVELNDDKIQKWLENPTKNPIDNSPIDNDYFNSTNKYFRIYNK